MLGLSPGHLILVILVVVLLFGSGRISGLMGDVAKGIKSFKKGLSDEEDPSQAQPPKRIEQPGSPTVEQKTHDEQKIGS